MIGEIFTGLVVVVVGGIIVYYVRRICFEKWPERGRRKDQRLSELASTVRSEIRYLNKKPVNLGGSFSITEWHLNSFSELTPFAENVKNFDKKRWKKIKGSWDKYRPPPIDSVSDSDLDLQRKFLHGIDRESLLEKLNNLLKSIENAF